MSGRGLRGVALAVGLSGCAAVERDELPPVPGTEPILLLPSGWNEILGGSETSCGDGSPWLFLVRKGSVNRLVIEFQDGGSCWSEESCFVHKTAITSLHREPDLVDAASNAGIHDKDDPANPVADWHHVLVSCCTGDAHWGSADQRYGERTFYHRGAVNVRAVLDWLAQNVWAPEEILVTGHAAGAYGSILWAPWVARQYPDATIVQLGDGGAGGVGEHFIDALIGLWNVGPATPSFIDGTTAAELADLSDLYRLVARGFPDMRLGEISSAYDLGQSDRAGWYGVPDARSFGEWLAADLAALERDVASFRSYRYPGSGHYVVGRTEMQTLAVGSARFRDWLAARIAGEPVESVDCGADCGGPLRGDAGHPAEWRCAVGRVPPPADEEPPSGGELELALHFARGPLAIENVDQAYSFGGLEVRACEAADVPCDRPIAQAKATTAGDARLAIPVGTRGFDGYLLVTGAGAVKTRLYAWPPVRSSGTWCMTGHNIGIETPASLALLLSRGEQSANPARGQLRVSMLDCARSFTARAAPTLDGLEPDTFVAHALDWVGAERTPRSLFVNVAPGVHTLTQWPDIAGARTTDLTVVVEAGSVTDVIGFGPGSPPR